jgi:hypothetical protein
MVEVLEGLGGVTVLDIHHALPVGDVWLRGWQIKTLAVYASSFLEVPPAGPVAGPQPARRHLQLCGVVVLPGRWPRLRRRPELRRGSMMPASSHHPRGRGAALGPRRSLGATQGCAPDHPFRLDCIMAAPVASSRRWRAAAAACFSPESGLRCWTA